jgi:hypothetical protein
MYHVTETLNGEGYLISDGERALRVTYSIEVVALQKSADSHTSSGSVEVSQEVRGTIEVDEYYRIIDGVTELEIQDGRQVRIYSPEVLTPGINECRFTGPMS